MQNRIYPSRTPLLDECMQVFAETIAEQFRMPASEAIRVINAELATNPLTRGMQLELPDPQLELQVCQADFDSNVWISS